MACTRIPARFRRDETLITTSFVSTTISLAFPLRPHNGLYGLVSSAPWKKCADETDETLRHILCDTQRPALHPLLRWLILLFIAGQFCDARINEIFNGWPAAIGCRSLGCLA